MPKQVCIYVPGILTWPGDADNWDGRAVTWTHNHTDRRAEKVEYFCGPIGRAFGQFSRIKKLYRTLDHYRDWEITLVGHSNGAAVILGCLQSPIPHIANLHLVCGACESNFNKNGINSSLLVKRIGKVFVYIGHKDLALRLAHTIPGKLLGYGTLGLHGPINVAPQLADRVGRLDWNEFGHSTCWHTKQFDRTMAHFVA